MRAGAYASLAAMAVATALASGCVTRMATQKELRDPFNDGAAGAGPAIVFVPALDLLLGAAPDEPGYQAEQLQHRVVLTPFAIGAYEITNAEFVDFLNEDGNVPFETVPAILLDDTSAISRDATRFAVRPGLEKRPVVRVTWQGARAYCRWLSRRTRRHYDLPTAAQWEAAARGGIATTWPWGNADDPARHRTNAAAAADVGSYPANAYGLHDTTGNVWEWTLDCFDPEAATTARLRDPVTLDDTCRAPEIRGGSFADGADMARPAFRANYWWVPAIDTIGFRVARKALGREGVGGR